MIVLADVDLDGAVDAVVHGAFGQAGQRRSATSRALADVRVRDAFLDRLVGRVADMKVGPGDDPASQTCPVVDTARIANSVKYGKSGTILTASRSRALASREPTAGESPGRSGEAGRGGPGGLLVAVASRRKAPWGFSRTIFPTGNR
ncbi:aldehyde dehydrogenase family protein [Streptomyces sclerotialus]|uniref:aldehyde dehydrogenase family protein n=1 Tax=Streptomyces sclerotialus TaxID=1957 RepID=UPI0004CB5140